MTNDENKNSNFDEEFLSENEGDGDESGYSGKDYGHNNDDGENEDGDDSVEMPKSKLILMKKLFENIKSNSEQLAKLMAAFVSEEDEKRIGMAQISDEGFSKKEEEGKVIEGVFDGENMIGPDGKKYSVPANYASKSKLVEGDIMKLTITSGGTFIYKQIGPIDRERVIGHLEKEADGAYYVSSDGKRWRVLPASVTYFKGQAGDETIILVPKHGESKWAAVENIIRNQE